jgi:hypothetical protein
MLNRGESIPVSDGSGELTRLRLAAPADGGARRRGALTPDAGMWLRHAAAYLLMPVMRAALSRPPLSLPPRAPRPLANSAPRHPPTTASGALMNDLG